MGRPAKYPEQFRRDAVDLVESSGRTIAEVARSLSINEGTLWNWVRDARAKTGPQRRPGRGERVRTRGAATSPQGGDGAPDRQGNTAAGGRVFRPGDDALIRFRFVDDHRDHFEVKWMCELVEVPKSSFYAWRNHTPSARERSDEVLAGQIREIYDNSRGTYGVPRVVGQLQRRGLRVARSRVARIMRVNGWRGAQSRRWRKVRPDGEPTEDLLNRDFRAGARTSGGWRTSRCSRPVKASCIWPGSVTCSLTASSVGIPATPRTRCWRWRR